MTREDVVLSLEHSTPSQSHSSTKNQGSIGSAGDAGALTVGLAVATAVAASGAMVSWPTLSFPDAAAESTAGGCSLTASILADPVSTTPPGTTMRLAGSTGVLAMKIGPLVPGDVGTSVPTAASSSTASVSPLWAANRSTKRANLWTNCSSSYWLRISIGTKFLGSPGIGASLDTTTTLPSSLAVDVVSAELASKSASSSL
mmetsp:Transcript_20453/g.47985  ORF Transcript_20453/g.47985 Transcript_20453/m.47985 type:complete len:201 (+) Transcript_20453:1288-1890(+)